MQTKLLSFFPLRNVYDKFPLILAESRVCQKSHAFFHSSYFLDAYAYKEHLGTIRKENPNDFLTYPNTEFHRNANDFLLNRQQIHLVSFFFVTEI